MTPIYHLKTDTALINIDVSKIVAINVNMKNMYIYLISGSIISLNFDDKENLNLFYNGISECWAKYKNKWWKIF